MLLITCPWCGPRDETEYHYGGQAHVAYPDDPAALTDERVGRVPVLPRQPQGALRRALDATAPAAAAGSTPSATPSRTEMLAVYRLDEPAEPVIP